MIGCFTWTLLEMNDPTLTKLWLAVVDEVWLESTLPVVATPQTPSSRCTWRSSRDFICRPFTILDTLLIGDEGQLMPGPRRYSTVSDQTDKSATYICPCRHGLPREWMHNRQFNAPAPP